MTGGSAFAPGPTVNVGGYRLRFTVGLRMGVTQHPMEAGAEPATLPSTPPWIIFEKSPRQRDRQTARRRRPTSSRRKSLEHTPKPEIRGYSPLRQVRSPCRCVPHLAIPRVLVAMILDGLKSQVGEQHMGQRGWPSRSPRNPPTCFCRSRRSWAHSRFSSSIMMCDALKCPVLSAADRFLQQTAANAQQIRDIEERVQSLAGVLTSPICDGDSEEKARREALHGFVPHTARTHCIVHSH